MTTFNDSYAEQLQELVTCAICLDHYQDPRLLPCSHTFCFECIQKTVQNGSFNCPFRDDMKTTQKDITQLPINRTAKDMVGFLWSINLSTDKKASQQCDNCSENQAVNWCEKCSVHYCEICTKLVHSIKALQSHTIIPSMEKVQSFCLDHSEEKFKYWCKQCEVLVCRDCLLFQHKDHTFSPLKEAALEAKTKFREVVQEVVEIKRNLTTFSETTKRIINERHETVHKGKQDIEQTFANLQRMLEERKRTLIKQLEDNELETMKILDQQQNTIDQHLNFTLVQELCTRKMLDSNDPMQILKFKSTLSHNYKDFTEQYKKIDEGYTIQNHTFEKKEKDVEQVSEVIAKLGGINSTSHIVNRDGIEMNILPLNISKPDGETMLTIKTLDWARGYKLTLKQPFRLHSIRIQSDYIGQHVGFIVNDVDVVISNGTVHSNDSTMKWLTIPLKCDIMNNYTVLVLPPSDNGSYTYKKGDNQRRIINENCSVESKYILSGAQTNVGSKVIVSNNTYSIDMKLDVED